MYSFGWLSVVALSCYAFLLMTFLAAKKDRLTNSFMLLLIFMILWTGGSYFMRLQMEPSVGFWFQASLMGLLFFPYAYLNFITEFLKIRHGCGKTCWFLLYLMLYLVNVKTEVFLGPPQVVYSGTGTGVAFVYDFSWPIVLLFLVTAMLLMEVFLIIYKMSKRDHLTSKQLQPVIAGILVMFVGHVFLLFPIFKGLPTDILSGVINACFLFYAMYRSRLFKLKLLVSRVNCYIIGAVFVLVSMYNFIKPLEKMLMVTFEMTNSQIIMSIATIVLVMTVACYGVLRLFMNQIFEKDEMMQSENLREFSYAVSKTLKAEDILAELVEVIQKTVAVDKIYICIEDGHGDYVMKHCASPLDKKIFSMKRDHPIIECLKRTDGCLLMKDFRRTTQYKSMWETEKQQLAEWKIECFVALKDEGDLLGIIMLSEKAKRASYSHDDMNFLKSVNSVSSIAVKNSRLYERAYAEARRDELTGLLNRKCFMETLKEQVKRTEGKSLALVILNIDDFKLYNQLYGNQEGDCALQRVAGILRASVGDNGCVARYGGKEFAIILPEYDIYAAKKLAENICAQVKNMNSKTENYALKMLTVSCGICAIPYTASTMEELIYNADMAVYHVKHTGKNAIMIYSAGEVEGEGRAIGSSIYKNGAYSEYASTIYALTAAIDTKDHYTFSHSKNVAYYAGELARACGLNQECVEIVKEAGLLHDIGKIGIPENILNKPGKLTAEEYEIMKGHVENSIGIIRHLPSLDYVIPAVIGHHERYDGKGYPRRIAGEDIPIMARILCVVDSFDAMISKRSYKKSMPVEDALRILEGEAGRQFDPNLATTFINLVTENKIELAKE